MRSLLGRFHRPFARGVDEQLLLLNNLGDGSTLSLDFTTGVLDPRLTFTRTTNATFINSQGYVEWAAANLQIYSQDQSQSGTWVRQDLSGVDANVVATTDPLGGNTASKLKSAATLQAHLVYSTVSTSINAGLAYTFSVYVKKAELKYVALHLASTARYTVVFDLDTGAMTTTNTTGTPTGTAYSSASAGDGWWRLSITMNSQSSPVYPHICLSNSATPATNASGQPYYTGVLNEGVYTWGAQLNPGSSPLAYVATTTAQKFDTPRFDYDPSTLQPRGLLIEGSAPTLNAYSEDFSNAYWQKINTTIDTTSVTCPDNIGRTTVRVVDNATNAAHSIRRGIATTAGTTYTLSFFVRKGSTDTFAAQGFWSASYNFTLTVSSIDNNTQSITSASGVNATATRVAYSAFGSSPWYRYSITFTHPAAVGAATPDFNFCPINNVSSYVGSGNYTDFFGIQLETGSGASSYIPTGASTGSRAFDSCVMDDITSCNYSTKTGTLFYAGRFTQMNASSFPNRVGFTRETGDFRAFAALSTTTALLPCFANSGTTVLATQNITLNSELKLAFSFDADLSTAEVKSSLNGGSIVQSGSSALTESSVPTYFMLGQKGYGAFFPHGTVRSVKYWPTALSTAQLQALTT